MSDVSISDLIALGAAPASGDLLEMVDRSLTTDSPQGSSRSMTVANLFTTPAITSPTITGTGTATLASATITGTATVGQITVSTAVGKIVPGATSISHRNTADNADNLLITDAGVATIRAGLVVTTGGITATGNSTITGTLGGVTTCTATTFVGALTGNASTSTKWAAPITINGTSVDGSTNVVLAGATTLTNRTTDLAESAGTATSIGLTQAITSGDSWHLTWRVAVQSDGNANGVNYTITLPTASKFLITAKYQGSTSVLACQTVFTATVPGSGWGSYDSSGVGAAAYLELDVQIVGASSSTTADLKFARATSGTQTVRAGASLVAIKM